MLADARVNMYVASGDESYLTRPYMRLIFINSWDKEWESDMSVPELAYQLAGKRGLLK